MGEEWWILAPYTLSKLFFLSFLFLFFQFFCVYQRKESCLSNVDDFCLEEIYIPV